MFRKIGLIINPEKEEAKDMAYVAESFFSEHGVDTLRFTDQSGNLNGNNPDLILTFGGDGTFLIGARTAMEYDIPIMGINLGTVGFLTEAEPRHLTGCLTSILNDDYRIEERFLLNIFVPKQNESFFALNDAVITRGGFARLIQVDCRVNNEQFGVFTADGMIAATPTGSTGYSLSAGGPIVQPEMNCIILTPVCAHSLQSCPCIVSGSSEITLQLLSERKQTAELQIDGMVRGKLESGDSVFVTGSDRTIRLLRIHPFHFFTLLQSKLNEWGSRHE